MPSSESLVLFFNRFINSTIMEFGVKFDIVFGIILRFDKNWLYGIEFKFLIK